MEQQPLCDATGASQPEQDAQAASRPFTPEDLLQHQRVVDLDGAPHRAAVVCALREADAEADTNHAALWLLPLDNEAPRPLTAGTAFDQSPRFSPDGRLIAFLSDRADGQPQVFLLPTDGGEARQLGHFAQGVIDFDWHPGGQQLCVTAAVAVDPDWRGAPAGDRQPKGADIEVVWRLPYKSDGLGYTLAQQIHLFTLDVADGTSRQLTHGAFEVRAARWSPDGRQLVFVRTREGRIAHVTDLWLTEADGSGTRQLTHDQPTAMAPVWSPDGSAIAFSGNVDDGDAQARVWLADVAAGTVRGLGSDDIEVQGDSLRWLPDGSALVFVLAQHGRRVIARLSVPGGELQPIVGGDRQITTLTCSGGSWVYTAETAVDPGRVLCCSADGRDERRLDSFNRWWDAQVPLRLESRQFTVPDGDGGQECIQGWLLRAAAGGGPENGTHGTPGRTQTPGPRPLLIDVHGGPASYAFLGYQYHAHWPVLCARGWSVLALNPVGSSSFGRRFTERLRGRWGQLDLPQQMAAVQTLQREGLADARVAITGKSYGGYLTAWAIGQTPDFRVAVVSAPVTNLDTHYGTSDSGYYADPYSMLGEPFLDRETSRHLSPMQQADRATTPTLILQGKEDERCPKCQAEELFVTLVRGSQSTCELVLYPGGDHHFFEQGQPAHRVDATRRLVEWLERWIGEPEAAECTPKGAASDGRIGAAQPNDETDRVESAASPPRPIP